MSIEHKTGSRKASNTARRIYRRLERSRSKKSNREWLVRKDCKTYIYKFTEREVNTMTEPQQKDFEERVCL